MKSMLSSVAGPPAEPAQQIHFGAGLGGHHAGGECSAQGSCGGGPGAVLQAFCHNLEQTDGTGEPAMLAPQLGPTVMTSWKQHALQQVTARWWTQAGHAGR